jgi:hypothetical protein
MALKLLQSRDFSMLSRFQINMYSKVKRKKKRFIIPEIPKGYKAYPFSVGNGFNMPENLAAILDDNGFDHREYEGSFIIPLQVYTDRGFIKRFVPWQALLFYNNMVVHVKDSLIVDERGTANKACADNMAYLRLNHCLLYGKLDIVCSNGKGANHIEVEYNTTAYNILEPNLDKFLKASLNESRASNVAENVYDRLKNIPAKYQNGVYMYILQKDEVLLDFIYLPRLVRKIGFIKINLTPNILFAITDRQIVVIQDDFSVVSLYTWILTFVPMDNVNGMSFEKQSRFTKAIIKIKRDNLLEELSFDIADKHTDDVKRLLAAVIK